MNHYETKARRCGAARAHTPPRSTSRVRNLCPPCSRSESPFTAAGSPLSGVRKTHRKAHEAFREGSMLASRSSPGSALRLTGLLLQSCGYAACADVPVLTSISPNGASWRFILYANAHWQTFPFRSSVLLGRSGVGRTTGNSSTITTTLMLQNLLRPGTVEVWASGIRGDA